MATGLLFPSLLSIEQRNIPPPTAAAMEFGTPFKHKTGTVVVRFLELLRDVLLLD